MQSNTALAWQDVPDAAPRSKDEIGPKGTFSAAHLVTDYFSVENRMREPVKWRIPRRSNRLEVLRRQLLASKAKWGTVLQSGLSDRPNAGKPLVGPLPIPEYRPKPSLACKARHAVSPDFTMPSDQVYVPGFTWQFRSMLNRGRTPDFAPLFTCTGLDYPGKEVA